MQFIKYLEGKENLSRVLAANERRFREVEEKFFKRDPEILAADVID